MLRWNGPLDGYPRFLTIAFVGCEKHRAVPDDRSTERSAELVELHARLGRCTRQERVFDKKCVVLIVLEQRTMEGVRTGAGQHVDVAANRSAVLGRKDALDDLDFRYRLEPHDVDLILAAVLAKSVVLGVGLRVGAVHSDACAAIADTVHPKALRRFRFVACAHTRRQSQQVANVAARNRELSHLPQRKGLDLRNREGLDQRCACGDRDVLRYLSDLEHECLT